MRRPLVALTIFASLAGYGCEDGPNDPYQTAPNGAGGVWNGNNNDAGPVVSDAKQSYGSQTGGTNANDICTADQVKAARTKYFGAPIQPPGLAAGLDIAGGAKGDGASGYDPAKPFTYDPSLETWTGATVEQVQGVLCQGVPDTIYYGVTTTLGWGDNDEVSVYYNANNRQVTDILLQLGYEGTMEGDSTDGKFHYTLNLTGQPIQKKDNSTKTTSNMILKWSDSTTIRAQVNELYDAYRHAFLPDFPADVDCVAAGHCIVGNNYDQGGYIWFTPLNVTFFVNTTVGTDQANSTPTLVDIGKLKLLGFSNAAVTLKLDAAGEGPVAIQSNVYSTGKNCKYHLGMLFSDFRDNCAEPFTDAKKNKTEEAKLFGSMGHGDETYSFDVQGIDPNFTATLAADKIVGDSDRPADADVAYELAVDQQVLGRIANDYTNNDTTQAKDWHGIGMLSLEWAYLVQDYMKTYYGVNTDLGDPDCIANPSRTGNPGGKVCSGIEGIVTTAPPAAVTGTKLANVALGAAAAKAFPALGVGMKPGTWYAEFCTDGAGLDSAGKLKGYKNCYGTTANYNGYYFDTMQHMIQQAYGSDPVPAEIASRRFYFKQWILALVKYLRVADNPLAKLTDMNAATNVSDPDDLFFDSAGGGFEFAEYVDRRTVNTGSGQPPTDIKVYTNLQTSVIDNFIFARHNFRGENALYSAVTTNSTDKPGAEKLLLQELVGSPLIVNTFGTYDCAINTDPAQCGGTLGPTDAAGKPILKDYESVFGQTIFHIPALGESANPVPVVVKTAGYELLASAMVSFPKWSNPFDPSTAGTKDPIIKAFVPYLPKGASVGFPVTIDGSRDKFYNTFNFDLTGETISANVDYEWLPDGAGHQQFVLRAIETTDYLGQVFMCAEPSPTVAGQIDVLAVRMYEPSQNILDWFTQHPSGLADCDVVYKYSIYGNYPDFITSRQYGIRLGINPGYGGGVVTDVTVFDPNVVASLGN